MLLDDIRKIKKKIKLKKEGVGVAASTLGSLEALLVYLKTMKIPVSSISIGDVTKSDLFKVVTPFLQEENGCTKTEYMTILCFDVKLLPEAKKYAELNKIKVIQAEIIYHLFSSFQEHIKIVKKERQLKEGYKATFPCVLRQTDVFNKKDPIILGVEVISGVLRPNTPICILTEEKKVLKIGVIESMQENKKAMTIARKKDGCFAIRIKNENGILHGRHLTLKNDLISIINRKSVNALKEYYRDEMLDSDWNLVRKLKKVFDII